MIEECLVRRSLPRETREFPSRFRTETHEVILFLLTLHSIQIAIISPFGRDPHIQVHILEDKHTTKYSEEPVRTVLRAYAPVCID